jgi:hypothetical protein
MSSNNVRGAQSAVVNECGRVEDGAVRKVSFYVLGGPAAGAITREFKPVRVGPAFTLLLQLALDVILANW